MEQLVNFVIRPPRADYSAKHDLLDQQFRLKGRWFQRKDFEIKNRTGLILQCSHYVPMSVPEGMILPCVIYCHGNSGCRADASEAAIILLPSNITVFTLDFSGSGLSGGEHVSLGWNEKEDLSAVVDYLRAEGSVSCIGLWGRSMGAVTCLMYGAEDPSIAGMVLDSPFSNLVDLMMELVDTYKYPLPKFTVKLAIQHMRRVIKKKANFDIMDLDAIQVAKCSFIPALFGHAEDDDFIPPHHSDRIYSAYAGDKNIIKFDGDHNSPRPQFYFDSITIFFHNVLNPPDVAYDERYFTIMDDDLEKGDWEATSFPRLNGESFAVPLLIPGSDNTEDAINQVRRRRAMSRIEVPSNVPQDENLQESKEYPSDLNPSSSSSSLVVNGDVQSSVPTVPDDPRYLEYSIDNSSDIPYSIDDEERMIMKAIMESLKDLEVRNTTSSDDSLEGGVKSSTAEPHCTSSSSSERTDLATASVSNTAASYTVSERTTDGTSCDELSNTYKNISDASTSQGDEAVAGTKATLVVQKTSSGHILDGLVQRWGSFFKGSG